MYYPEQIDVLPRTARRSVTFPLQILVCITAHDGIFNPFQMMSTVFGRWAENRANNVFKISVFAPDISTDSFNQRFGNIVKPKVGSHFDQMTLQAWRGFDIVHMVGPMAEWTGSLAGRLALGSLTRSTKTRLLIFQTPRNDFESASRVARQIVSSQGPTVLATAGDSMEDTSRCLEEIYAGIVHNAFLTEVAKSLNWQGVDARLAFGRRGDGLLRFDAIRREAEDRLARLTQSQNRHVDHVRILQSEGRLLHKADRAVIEGSQGDFQSRIAKLRVTEMNKVMSSLRWDHESMGAIPLAETMRGVESAEVESEELDRHLGEVRGLVHSVAEVAPRVLNANFAGVHGKVIEPTTALLPECDYDLLVDIGPRWDKIPSIVTGNAAFPEAALPPPTQSGTKIRVVAISDDFSPRICSTLVNLPIGSGRSGPWGASKPGPAKLRLRTPTGEDSGGLARLRVSLYYEGNLLQSGVVCVTIHSGRLLNSRVNTLVVDYVLSGGFHELPDAFRLRNIRLPGRDDSRPSVALNLTLNDDGAGGHRVVVLAEGAPEAAFLPYDPTAGKQAMDRSRKALLELFFEKTDRGVATTTSGLQKDNGKPLVQFKRDLWGLADLGRQLLLGSFGAARVEGKPDEIAIQYLNELQSKIASSSLIQISRTGPAQYVFPWALLYSHPLTGEPQTWKYCSIIDEQWAGGRRSGAPLGRCPYHQEESDHDNVICPLGFWGLQHIIEQPLSALVQSDGSFTLANAISTINAGPKVNVALARTSDSTMTTIVDAHLAQLALDTSVQYSPPTGATTATAAAAVFQVSELIYILCHGNYDALRAEPYLGIGASDSSYEHRIYPTTLQNWGTKSKAPTLSSWPKKRPLVFVNGCHTCDLLPGQMLNIVSALNSVGAGGVVGTEVSVQLPVAVEMANSLFRYLLPSPQQGVGEALHSARWDLANKGNLLGLAYTAYCMADLKIIPGPN